MSERSCPVSAGVGSECPMGNKGRTGPRGCNFMSFSQQGDLRAAFDIPNGVDPDQYLRQRERKAINEVLYSDVPSMGKIKEIQTVKGVKSLDLLNVDEHDLLAVALGAPARQVLIRAEEVGPRTGWRDGYLSTEYGFCPPDAEEAAGALGKSPGRVWSDLCERMPGCVARGRVRESVAALPIVQGTVDVIPDKALWAALVSLGMLCSIYRYEEKHNGKEGVSVSSGESRTEDKMSDELGDEVKGIPRSIGLPFYQISKRMGRSIPHLTFFDQSSYNLKVRDPTSTFPYVGRFDNTELRWPMFGDRSEIAFLKGCADTSASFQHGVDAIATCQEHVMNRNKDGLLRELIRLKEILERMPNAFHTISMNPNSGDNYVSPAEWVRWAKFSAPLSKRCPATSGLQFPPYLLMDAFLGRSKYESFLGAEGIHLRAWLPSNWRAFTAAIEYHYRIPDFVAQSGDPQLIGALDGIVEAYTGERGFMGTHRYKVFGLLEVAGKTGRAETNGNSGSSGSNTRPWEETHQAFSDSMKERLEPFRGNMHVEPHQMRGTFAECRFMGSIINRSFVDLDPERSIAKVTFDIQGTGITFQPGDRLAIMPFNSLMECAKVAAALGLDTMLNDLITPNNQWTRFSEHLGSVSQTPTPHLAIKDILRRGHLSPLTKESVMKLHTMLQASSNTLLQVLATSEWPVRASLGDLLQAAVIDTSSHVWDQAFDISGDLSWLCDLVPVEVPRTYSISNYPDELLPSTIDLTVSRSEFNLSPTFSGSSSAPRHGVSSGFLNPPITGSEEFLSPKEDILIGVSRPLSFQLPIHDAAPCAFFAGGSGIAPFRSFWQARAGNSVGRNMLFLGVQSREKFCYEKELREYVREGSMEVYTAFSRDSRGLVFDRNVRDLVEKEITPRYIDTLIIEQGATVCDLVMSKKQGGLGGYLYVCGSISVFDSVMSGIRKAIYNNRTQDMESTDVLLNTAFAERRFMLDVFMTPKPLPCNIPTIPLSELSLNTGHLPGSRVYIAVHGSVYDVTEFGIMHPGGVNIIKSNAGVDCSKTFDLLAHTNNPEVSSLLNKYFIAHLTPKPEFHQQEEISMLYDLWADYLRASVETLVSQAFEVQEFMDSSALWFQGSLFNMGGVRRFYHHQSRLLQNGFSTLFGAKLQELYLKLSFTNANSSTVDRSQLPDILGIIARAKVSKDAVTTSSEVSEIGRFTSDSNSARFHEKGILNYARKSVQLDMELLEGIREEACTGMDAFATLADMEPTIRASSLSLFLLQILERVALRLESFYSKLAETSIYNPEIELNPARTRWNRIQRRIKDRSFFVLTHDLCLLEVSEGQIHGNVRPPRASDVVEFDQVISRIQQNIDRAHYANHQTQQRSTPSSLTERHFARTEIPQQHQQQVPVTAYESHEDENALRKMISFMEGNKRDIRRLSKLPATGVSLEQLVATYGVQNRNGNRSLEQVEEFGDLQEYPETTSRSRSNGNIRQKASYSLFPKDQHQPKQQPNNLPTPPPSRSSSRSTTISRTARINHATPPAHLAYPSGSTNLYRGRAATLDTSLSNSLDHRKPPISDMQNSGMRMAVDSNLNSRSQSQSYSQRSRSLTPAPSPPPPAHRNHAHSNQISHYTSNASNYGDTIQQQRHDDRGIATPARSPLPGVLDFANLGLNRRNTNTGGSSSHAMSTSERLRSESVRSASRRRESLTGPLRTLVLQHQQQRSGVPPPPTF